MDPLGTLIAWIAEYGLIGLIAVGLAERFVPVLPSYGVLVAIGIAAASGTWSVETALTATVFGSLAGCLCLYWLVLALGEPEAHRMLKWIGRLGGMPASRVDGMVSSFHAHQRLLAFVGQLVPTVRLISPVIAGFFRADARAFTIATMAGIVVWNGLFIGVGHVAAAIAPMATASVLAINVLLALIVTELTLGLMWRWFSRRPVNPMKGPLHGLRPAQAKLPHDRNGEKRKSAMSTVKEGAPDSSPTPPSSSQSTTSGHGTG